MDKRSAHNNFNLQINSQLYIQLSSSFDSGNLQSVSLISVIEPSQDAPLNQPIIKLQLTPASQPFNPMYSSKQSVKSFFHFNIKTNKNITLHACIKKMNILSIIQGSFDQYYRICIGSKKLGQQLPQYSKYRPDYMEFIKNGEQYILQFKYDVQCNEKVYFAYHFPYSYQRLCHFLQDLNQNFKHSQEHIDNNGLLAGVRGVGVGQHNNIYFRNQLLIQSTQGRQINLLTITQIPNSVKKSGFNNIPRQTRISKSLFPYYDIQDRPFKFNKPYIMVTSRVHPGQTSASYAIQGFIKRLIGSSPEAQFLRKMFVFLIVPMLNPDGVYHGTYRMDMLGHNLNRFYNNCVAHKQPSIFAISSLLQYHSEDLLGFFDFHSHPQAKGSFAYGNAYNSIQDQIQSQVFTKLLSINSQSFNYQNCTFSQKNMNSKDINDILTKDGSSRVCAYKKMMAVNLCNGVHCYAIELGYHGCPVKKDVNKSQQINQFKSPYRRATKQFDINDYIQHGTDLINTIAQIYIQTYRNFAINQENPGLIPQNQTQQQIQNSPLLSIRQQIAKQAYDKDERFRIMDAGLLKKIRNIQNIIYTNLYSKILKKYQNISELVKQYDNKKIKKDNLKNKILQQEAHERNIKVVHSLQLNKNHIQLQNKKIVFQHQMGEEEELKKIKQRIPHRDIKNIIFRSKEKINIVPLQFNISNPKSGSDYKSRGKREVNFNKILQMQADSLPRIQKKKFNFLTERHRMKQKRIQSSINSNNNFNIHTQFQAIPYSRGGLQKKMFRGSNDKGTIDSNIDQIIHYQNMINVDVEQDQQQYQKHFEHAAYQYKANYNLQMNNMQNMQWMKNQAMFSRKGTNQQRNKKQIQINNFTDRLNRRNQTTQQRNRSKSKQKILISAQNQNLGLNVKALPKLNNVDKIRNRFDLQLQMKSKYDRQYKIDDKLKIQQEKKDRHTDFS